MNRYRLNNKILFSLVVMFIIFVVYVMTSIQFRNDDEFMNDLLLHKEIEESQISSIRMSKVINKDSFAKHIDVDLNESQIDQIIALFNSVPPESIRTVNMINSSISSGIVFRLKSRSEIRIQYDRKDIYVTRTDIRSEGEQIKYIIEQDNLKDIFDNEIRKQ